MRKIAGSACIILIGLGQSISGWQSPFVGFALMAAGLFLGLISVIADERVKHLFPYVIVRRSAINPAAVPGGDGSQGGTAQATIPSLGRALQDQLKRGRKIRSTASITPEGSSGPIEIWEHEVAVLLEDADRHDLLTRFEESTAGDRFRALMSGPWSTRSRMDRRLHIVSEFIRELPD
jgi:hypothetical protein